MFEPEDLIFTYTTKQAIKDGYLVHIPEKITQSFGVKFQALISRNLWDIFELNAKTRKNAFTHMKNMFSFYIRAVKASEKSRSLNFVTVVHNHVIDVKVQIRQFDFDDSTPALFFTLTNED
jgi:hypothetical protein